MGSTGAPFEVPIMPTLHVDHTDNHIFGALMTDIPRYFPHSIWDSSMPCLNITSLGAAPSQSLRSPRAPLRSCPEPLCVGLQRAGSPAGCRCGGLVGAVAAGMQGMEMVPKWWETISDMGIPPGLCWEEVDDRIISVILLVFLCGLLVGWLTPGVSR